MPTPSTSVRHLIALLNHLAERARKPDKPDLSPAIALVDDLGRLVMRGHASDIRTAQAAVAGVREQLDWGDAGNTPYKALTGNNSHAYLAGAMWAVNELMSARLDSLDSAKIQGRVTRKSWVRDLVLDALTSADDATPSSLVARLASVDETVRLDEISRSLSDMLSAGLIEQVPPQPGADRRTKCFALTRDGISATSGKRQ